MKARVDLSVDFQKWRYVCADEYRLVPSQPSPLHQGFQKPRKIRAVCVCDDVGTKTIALLAGETP